ncbi:MAG: hypothetical protein Q8O83_03655 [bacterium]|nr:hypothetical protein [bacterium]
MEKDTVSSSFFVSIFIPVIAFALGFGFAWLLFSGEQKDRAAARNESNTASDVFSLPLGHNSVSVDAQDAGDSVFISLATLSRGAWLAVHEDQHGVPSNILGARYFPGGKTAGTVELLRNTAPGKTYYAVIHADDGDREFNFRQDEALQDPFGNLIMDVFQTFSENNSGGVGDRE